MASTASRGRTDLTSDKWGPWINEVCTLLGVDPDLVDVTLVHDLTKHIAHRYDRPMAPVGSYIMGIALGAGLAREAGTAEELLAEYAQRIESTLPAE